MTKIAVIVSALLFLASTAFSQWVQQASPVLQNLLGVCFTSPANGWIVGANGTLLRTTNGGADWAAQTSPTVENLNKIVFLDSAHGYIVGDGDFFGGSNTMLVTTNGGGQWKLVYDGNTQFSNYYGIEISDSRARGWIVGGWQAYGLSAVVGMKLGYSEVQISSELGRCAGVDFVDDQLGWVVGMNRLILKTTNGGTNWVQQSGAVGAGYTGLNSVKFFNRETGLAVGDGGVILKTTNGGAQWHAVREQDEVLFWADVHADSVAYVVGSNNTVLKSTDQGETWQAQTTPAPAGVTLSQSFFISAEEGWIAGTGGTILHTTNGGLTGVADAGSLPAGFRLRAAYPNPFNPSTAIEYDIPQESDVSLTVYDMSGRMVERFSEGSRSPGSYKSVWNAARFASGVYYVRLTAKSGGSVHTAEQKIVLMK
jgi:photosystem II stability/assembly factor-like uncharacterized protein